MKPFSYLIFKIVSLFVFLTNIAFASDFFTNLDHFKIAFETKHSRPPNSSEIEKAEKDIRITNANFNRISEVFYAYGYDNPGLSIIAKIYSYELKHRTELVSRQKIITLGKNYLLFEGKELKKRSRCFTCSMRVLTPEGYRPIGELKVGDTVVSWDFDNEDFIETQIEKVHETADVEFGELSSDIYINGAIEVTPDHPFYSPEYGVFLPVNQLSDTSQVLGSRHLSLNQCSVHLTGEKTFNGDRGTFVMRGMTTVRTISVSGKHKNYFVEGVLVRNKPIHIT